MPTTGPICLRVSGLSVVRQERIILNNLSFDLAKGQTLCISGPSGCGKSTLLRVLSLLEPFQSGQLWLDGVPVEELPFTEYRRRVSLLLQEAPMFAGSVADNLRFGPALLGKSLDDACVQALLERVSLASTMMNRNASELSGGERQRVALARSLANNPSVLLLDEPTSALDPQAASEVISHLRQLAEQGLSVVAVMHVPEHVKLLGGRSLTMHAGALDEASL